MSAVQERVEKDYRAQEAEQALKKDLDDLKGLDAQARATWIQEHKAHQWQTGFLSPEAKDTSEQAEWEADSSKG